MPICIQYNNLYTFLYTKQLKCLIMRLRLYTKQYTMDKTECYTVIDID